MSRRGNKRRTLSRAAKRQKKRGDDAAGTNLSDAKLLASAQAAATKAQRGGRVLG